MPHTMTISPTALAFDTGPIGLVARGLRETQSGSTPREMSGFAIGDDQYGVDIMAVREIEGRIQITHRPKQPGYVRGVFNLLGVVVLIIDRRCRFGRQPAQATPLHVVIIKQVASKPVGRLADRVLDIASLEDAQIQPAPAYRASRACRIPPRLGDDRRRHDRIDRAAQSAYRTSRNKYRRGRLAAAQNN